MIEQIGTARNAYAENGGRADTHCLAFWLAGHKRDRRGRDANCVREDDLVGLAALVGERNEAVCSGAKTDAGSTRGPFVGIKTLIHQNVRLSSIAGDGPYEPRPLLGRRRGSQSVQCLEEPILRGLGEGWDEE